MKRLWMLLVLFGLLVPGTNSEAQTALRSRVFGLSRSVQVRYNRVEGPFLGLHLNFSPSSWQGAGLFAGGGYGVANRSPRWEAGVDYRGPKATATFSLFDRTETNDPDIVRTGENTLFALLFKWDYHDYFRAKNGFELKGSYRLRRNLVLLGRLTGFRYVSMPVATQWSLFYPDRVFRANPAVRPGKIGLLQLGFLVDSRPPRSPRFYDAWVVSGFYERAFREFDYNGLILEVRRYQKVIFGNQAFVLQGRFGTRGSTAEQHLFGLGGVGTLRGFGIKEFKGNRMVMFNFDYLFGGDLLNRVPLPGFHLLNLAVFLDSGWTRTVPEHRSLLDGFGNLSLQDFKTDVGAGVYLPLQVLRIDVARRLDRRSAPWVVSVRILKKL